MPTFSDERLHLLALNLTGQAGPMAAAARLYRLYGKSGRGLFAKATRVDRSTPPEWPQLPPDVREGTLTEANKRLARREITRMVEADVSITTWLDDDYPENLRHIVCPPPVLYRRGSAHADDRLAVAVVGSRKASADYIDFARRIGYELARAGITVVSGLARGIDRAAHEGALQGGGRTLAVLGTGIDVCYPKAHEQLARRIADQGAMLTYFPMGTPPLPHHFPARNWVLAGLALITVVVQCDLRSGALITAHYATAQGRDVMAVPGYVESALYRGSNALIKDGAAVVTRPEDVVDIFHHNLTFWGMGTRENENRTKKHATLEDKILDALDAEITEVDRLALMLNHPVDALQSELVRLELDGKVQAFPGGRYRRIHV